MGGMEVALLEVAESLVYDDVASPVGRLRLIGSNDTLVAIWFEHGRDAARNASTIVKGRSAALVRTRRQLDEYFSGTRRSFDLRLAPRGTEFQQRVWARLQCIDYGATMTYGALAADLGNPKASRAVGFANGSNPIPIVIPCHRVIGADGSLTGFGGGLPIKSILLSLERVQRQPRLL
jgi:methylated-DNA-[protein]-cysteine S-methyltransferase